MNPEEVAEMLILARRSNHPLMEFPGQAPQDLASAYLIQEAIIDCAAFPQSVGGWKIGTIPPHFRDSLLAERFVGPIMSSAIHRIVDCEPVTIPVFEGGFLVVEAEYAVAVANDVPTGDAPRTMDELIPFVAGIHCAIEVNGSPLASLGDLGPASIVAEHGGNCALVIGAKAMGWPASPGLPSVQLLVDDRVVSPGSVSTEFQGGPLGALAFLVDNLAQRGRTLKAGHFVASGALCATLDVRSGSRIVARFGDVGTISIELVARPHASSFFSDHNPTLRRNEGSV